jgi:hypothetical protein
LTAIEFLGFLFKPLISFDGSITKSSSISHAFFLLALAPPCLCLLYISLLPLEFGSLLRTAVCLGSSLLLVLLEDSGPFINLAAIDESNVLSEAFSFILRDDCL